MLQRHSYQHQQTEFNYSSDQSRDLDLEYLDVRERIVISQYYRNGSKHIKIRLAGWIQKLDQIIANPTWKRNRNHYIKLIKLICECETVVSPFDSLPPQGDVPKLNKHQINHIIDAIERVVKSQKSNRKGSTQVFCEKVTANIKPQDYWTKIKNAREAKHEEESVFLGRFTHITQEAKKGRNTYYSMAEENQFSKVQDRQNICHSDIKGKENVISNKLSNSTNKQTQSSQKNSKQPKRLMIKLSLQPKITNKSQVVPQSQSKIASEQSFQFEEEQIHAFKDTYISIAGENNTLKTEMFDQDLSIHESSEPQFSYISTNQCDFNDELSERCRNKNQIPNHSYFSWRAKQEKIQKENFNKQKNKFVEITPCKPPIIQVFDHSPHLVTVTRSQLQWQQNVLKQSGITSKLQMFSIEQSQGHQSMLKDIKEQVSNQIIVHQDA